MKEVTMLGLGIYTEDEDIIDIEEFSSQVSMLDYKSVLISDSVN